GTSARYSRGMLKASHSQMNRAALSAESTKSTPPLYFGWLATMPTGRPAMRPRQVMTSWAKSFFTSNNEPASTSSLIRANMSKGLFWSAGMISSIRFPERAGGFGSAMGGVSEKLGREYER